MRSATTESRREAEEASPKNLESGGLLRGRGLGSAASHRDPSNDVRGPRRADHVDPVLGCGRAGVMAIAGSADVGAPACEVGTSKVRSCCSVGPVPVAAAELEGQAGSRRHRPKSATRASTEGVESAGGPPNMHLLLPGRACGSRSDRTSSVGSARRCSLPCEWACVLGAHVVLEG